MQAGGAEDRAVQTGHHFLREVRRRGVGPGVVARGEQADPPYAFDTLTIADTGRRFSLTAAQSETLRRFYARGSGSVTLDLRGCPSVKVGER